MIQKDWDAAKLSRCIEVKGMNGLSISYIQRFFGHVGPVEEVKKVQDLVVVRFKNQGSIAKALRSNGRVIDEQPIKIRSIIPVSNLEVTSHKKNQHSLKSQSKQAESLNELLKNRSFDISFIWSNILKIINKLHDILVDDKIIWLLHEIFYLKFSQVVHFHAFGTNMRSSYAEIVIKEHFINESVNSRSSVTLVEGEGNMDRLEVLAIPSSELTDEPNFECFLASSETRLKSRLQHLFQSSDGNCLYELYAMLNAYSLHIPVQESIFSSQPFDNNPGQFSISKQLVTENRANVSLSCLSPPSGPNQRSEYREISTEHPNKEIQILSDSCLNYNSFESSTYDIFRDDFDGNLTNCCAMDMFWQFRMYFASNLIVARVRDHGKLYYYRLGFELRMINCEGQIFTLKEYFKILEQYQNKTESEVTEIKLLKHNLVVSDFEQAQKIVYIIENYVKLLIPELKIKETKEAMPLLNIIIMITNLEPSYVHTASELCQQLLQREGISLSYIKVFCVKVDDIDKFDKVKCTNFIEEYVDTLKGSAFTFQFAKFHAKKLIEEHPSRFKHLPFPEQFVTQTLWKLEQEKSKREAKNRVKMQLHKIRIS